MKGKKIVSTLLALLLLASLPVSALAAEWDIGKGDITVNAGSGGQTVTQGGGAAIPDSAPVITGTSKENNVTINADSGQTANVTLSGANIDVSSAGKAAVSTTGEGNVNIELNGSNALKSGHSHAGLEKNNDGNLTIQDKDKDGSLNAKGGQDGAGIGGGSSGAGSDITITGGKVTAIGKGDAAGIGGYADVSITGGEIDVSVEGSGVAIGGNGGGSINIQGNAIKSISSRSGACIGGSAKNITILDAELPFLGGEGILIGNEVGDNTGGDLTIRNCRILSTYTEARGGIQVGNNGKIQIENSEITLSRANGIRTGDSGSIAIRDSQLVTNGIYMGEEGMTQRKLKRLEITNSTVVTNDVLGSTGKFTSVGEIVIHGSSIRQSSEDRGNGFGIGCGEYGTFDRIDIQDSQIDIPGFKDGVAIGGGRYTKYTWNNER